MTTTKDKLEFALAMGRHTRASLRQVQALMRYAATLQRLSQSTTDSISPGQDRIAAKREHIGKLVTETCLTIEGAAIPAKSKGPWRTTCPSCGLVQQGRQLCKQCGAVCPSETPRCVPVFSGDPRGAVLKIRVPDGFGDEGIVVPS